MLLLSLKGIAVLKKDAVSPHGFPLGKQPFKRGPSGEPINFNRGGNSNISGIFYPDLWGNDPS